MATRIDFNEPNDLATAATPGRPDLAFARWTWATTYREDGMTVTDGVVPRDPRLGGRPEGEYHLNYVNPAIDIFKMADKQFDPRSEPRSLSCHDGDSVIQLTYDPNNDGVLDPFNLLSMDVFGGGLRVGLRYASGEIAVTHDLAPELNWGFPGGDFQNLTRVTLEATGSVFTVDNIVFEPFTPALPITTFEELEAVSDELSEPAPELPTPEVHDNLELIVPSPIAGEVVLITGTARNDVLRGGGEGDRVTALAGADNVRGFGGADELFGQGGADTMFGGRGRDALSGGGGDDGLFGGRGADELLGWRGNDTLRGGAGADIAAFAGPASGYEVALTGAGAGTVRDIDVTNGNEGTDVFSDVEVLRFTDQTINVDLLLSG